MLCKRNIVSVVAILPLMLNVAIADNSSKEKEIQALKQQLQELYSRMLALESNQTKQTKQLNLVQKQASESKKKSQKAKEIYIAQSSEKAGYFRIPQTQSHIKLYGQANFTAMLDLGAVNSGCKNFLFSPKITLPGDPQHEVKQETRIHAKQSRIGIHFVTPADIFAGKELTAVIETDFFGEEKVGSDATDHTHTMRLRHAYITAGRLTMGQTWSVFFDADSLPEKVDFVGPTGVCQIRSPQIRYTQDFQDNTQLMVSIENPESDYVDITGATHFPTKSTAINFDRWPDFAASIKQKYNEGYVMGRVIIRNVRAVSSTVENSRYKYDKSELGFGLGLSGLYKFENGDNVFSQINVGKGVGRYITDAYGYGAYLSDNGNIHTQSAYGGSIGAKHYWTKNIRSSIAFGYTRILNHKDLQGNVYNNGILRNYSTAINKSFVTALANLLWTPDVYKNLNMGLEYLRATRHVEGNRVKKGILNRFMLGAQASF